MRSCDATFSFNLKRNPVRRIFLLGSASFCVVVFELTLFALTFFLKKISDIRRLARPTEAGCQTIIASGELATFFVKPDGKMHKSKTRQLAGPIHMHPGNNHFKDCPSFDLSEVI